jgi:hypothetical protein
MQETQKQQSDLQKQQSDLILGKSIFHAQCTAKYTY